METQNHASPKINLDEQFVSAEEAARILGLDKRYAGECIRNGFLKGKIGYLSHSGRNYRYNLTDLLRVRELATVPATKK